MDFDQIQSLYKQGYSINDIVKIVDVKRYWIKKAIKGIERTVADTNSLKARLNSKILSESEQQCILGTLLGDGCLKESQNGRSHHLSVTHGDKQKDYIKFKHKILQGSYLSRVICSSGYCPGSIQWNLTFWNAKFMDYVFSISQKNEHKYVSDEWLQALTLEGLAYWFMDDGSSSYANNPGQSVCIAMSTMCFSYEENCRIAIHLNKYKIDARVVKASRGTKWQISMSVKGGQRFLKLIQPYVEQIPSMTYKLKIKN